MQIRMENKNNKIGSYLLSAALMLLILLGSGLALSAQVTPGTHNALALTAADKSALQQKASKWVQDLKLSDAVKEKKVVAIIQQHLESVYGWNKSHDYRLVPAGINPINGQPLSALDRKIISQSAIPKEVHTALMEGLNENLTPGQVEQILDDYTIGKVAFTLKGYQAIVPDLTSTETAEIVRNLKQAREQAIDFKNMKSISGIFEIYKTKNEQYLGAHGRNWHQLFKDYVNAVKAKKAAGK
jgi:hypothetical protein